MNAEVLRLQSRTIWQRVVSGGPYVNEVMSISVLSSIILIGVGLIALADQNERRRLDPLRLAMSKITACVC